MKQLDEPFLVVVVGEFNSGKSRWVACWVGGGVLLVCAHTGAWPLAGQLNWVADLSMAC